MNIKAVVKVDIPNAFVLCIIPALSATLPVLDKLPAECRVVPPIWLVSHMYLPDNNGRPPSKKRKIQGDPENDSIHGVPGKIFRQYGMPLEVNDPLRKDQA